MNLKHMFIIKSLDYFNFEQLRIIFRFRIKDCKRIKLMEKYLLRLLE